MTIRHLRPGLFCGLGAAALSMILWDYATGAAAGEAGNAFETIPPNEADEIDELSKLATVLQDKRRDNDPSQEGMLLRGVHPKSHGCVRAQFAVDDDLDASLRVGLFATPGKTYEAWIRYSNAAVLREDDLKAADPTKLDARSNGSRGMAIKVVDVEGEMLSEDDGRANQDFLMINTPEFAFASVRDYLRLNRIMMLPVDSKMQSPTGDKIDAFFLPILPRHLPVALGGKGEPLPEAVADIFKDFNQVDLKGTTSTATVVKKIVESTVRNPLEVQYFGAAPFAFGPERAMKFSAAPCERREQAKFERIVAGDPSPNYLSEALSETMKGDDDVCFNFMIQVEGADKVVDLGIEDATTTWPNEVNNYKPVARITIPAPQDPTAADVVAQCEAMAFTPWHSLAAHRPLGGINRLRQQVYVESARHRRAQGYE